jgi:hypothetical protein
MGVPLSRRARGRSPHHLLLEKLGRRLAVRVGKPQAIVAIAPKLLLVVWHVLTKHVADREALPEKVAGKFLEWSWKLGRVNRAGLTSGAFIRRELRRLQLGENVTTISRGKRRFPIPLAEGADKQSAKSTQSKSGANRGWPPPPPWKYRPLRDGVKAAFAASLAAARALSGDTLAPLTRACPLTGVAAGVWA